jgi:hypothetical protein
MRRQNIELASPTLRSTRKSRAYARKSWWFFCLESEYSDPIFAEKMFTKSRSDDCFCQPARTLSQASSLRTVPPLATVIWNGVQLDAASQNHEELNNARINPCKNIDRIFNIYSQMFWILSTHQHHPHRRNLILIRKFLLVQLHGEKPLKLYYCCFQHWPVEEDWLIIQKCIQCLACFQKFDRNNFLIWRTILCALFF